MNGTHTYWDIFTAAGYFLEAGLKSLHRKEKRKVEVRAYSFVIFEQTYHGA